ncbi:MAG: hypothetical protein HY301_18720 [Verrucomicrobia bacterium]|nr:hypothetical protein [Verrucomicrobiota bacterium]
MAEDFAEDDSPLDRLWDEYALAFKGFDDLTLARWMSQTLAQFEGRVWRLSHPLFGAYRLAAQIARDRHLTLRSLVTLPANYPAAPCCGAPLLPLLTRDVLESGLVCQHCNGTCVPLEEIPGALLPEVRAWAEEYAPIHQVAHWDDRQRKSARSYDRAYEDAAQSAEKLLALAGTGLAPKFLEQLPTLIWEDQDECLEVRPEDVPV